MTTTAPTSPYVLDVGNTKIADLSEAAADGTSKDRLEQVNDRKTGKSSTDQLSSEKLHKASATLANLLFIYSQLTSAVVCSKCDATIEDEHEIENILDKHDAKSPDCKLPRVKYENYIKNKEANSTPSLGDLEKSEGARSDLPSSKRDILFRLDENVVSDTYGSSDEDMYEDGSRGNHVTTSSATGCGSGVYHPTNAKYPNYLNRIERTLSLGRWDNPFRFNVAEAAEAGLFYPGSGKDLLCHYCGFAVPPLKKSDDAWIEHARLSPGCGFVKFEKGQRYIRNVQEMYDDCDIEDSVLNQELASIEQNTAMHLTESQLAPELPAQSAAATPTSSSQSTNVYEPQPGTSNGHASHPTVSTGRHDITSSLSRRVPRLPRVQPVARPHRPPRIPKRQVQAREVRARLDMEWARRLIGMGYSAELVGAVIAEQMIYNGDDFKSYKDMLMATVEAADMGDDYPVRHYALGLTQNTAMSSGSEGSSINQQPPSATPRSRTSSSTTPSSRSSSNSAMALSVGASSWTETTAPAGSQGNSSTVNNIETSVGNLSLESKILEKENRELKDKKMCKICYERDANIVFIPCGHLVVCENCNIRINECPLCRRGIRGILKAFLS
ncbi:death-associated inhibitor of apoptosis 1-like [Lineus longissimus]|uniref:death-associated inhibitor of apoptosis 1-like n=1 Tax=Lineus longissimus TaxID=88925 RepID=UPI002B4DB14A